MTIWFLAIVLTVFLAALGYRQGAIRVACSLVGILVGALLAVPFGKPFAILLKAFGAVHPVVLWLVPPVIAFLVISAIFKGIAFAIHHKVEVYFKYKAGDLRLTLWERMNRRLGLCLGIVNGVAYLILISFIIYVLGYWSVQMETGSETRKAVKLLNRAALDLQGSGFSKTARALETMPKSYYDAADIVGELYQNPALEARLSRYPAFLMLGERQEFQDLAKDATFAEMRGRQDSLSQLMEYGPVQAIVKNPDMLRTIWGIVEPNLKDGDLKTFLDTGASPKFADETILGRWKSSVRGMVAAYRRSKPNATPAEIARIRATYQFMFSKVNLVVGFTGDENQLVVKGFPNLKAPLPTAPAAPGTPPPSPELMNGQGSWSGARGNYQLTLNLGGSDLKAPAVIEGDRLTITVDKIAVVFDREL